MGVDSDLERTIAAGPAAGDPAGTGLRKRFERATLRLNERAARDGLLGEPA